MRKFANPSFPFPAPSLAQKLRPTCLIRLLVRRSSPSSKQASLACAPCCWPAGRCRPNCITVGAQHPPFENLRRSRGLDRAPVRSGPLRRFPERRFRRQRGPPIRPRRSGLPPLRPDRKETQKHLRRTCRTVRHRCQWTVDSGGSRRRARPTPPTGCGSGRDRTTKTDDLEISSATARLTVAPSSHTSRRSMPPPSMYSPDRSLSIAGAVLIGGSLLAAAVVYLLTTSAGTLTDWHRARLTETQTQKEERSTAHRPVRQPDRASRSRSVPNAPRRPSSSPRHASSWDESGRSVTPPRSPTRGTYDLQPDMSHANLGSPSDDPNSERTSGKVLPTEPAPSSAGNPSAGSAPLTADLSAESSSEGTAWRSGASTLGRRARALSRALAHLDRANKSADKTGRAGRSRTSGNASTASANGGPRAAADSPDPPSDPEQVPVDGGLGWLAAAGAAYAANRLRKSREASDSDDEA